MPPTARVRHRDHYLVARPGPDLLVASRADVGLVCLVWLDVTDLRDAADHRILHEAPGARGRPVRGSVSGVAGSALLGPGAPRGVASTRSAFWRSSGHVTDYVAHSVAPLAGEGPALVTPRVSALGNVRGVADMTRAEKARSFGAVADGYDRYRPAPPREALDWLLPVGAADVLDLGAGTGAVARLLRERARLPLPRGNGRRGLL